MRVNPNRRKRGHRTGHSDNFDRQHRLNRIVRVLRDTIEVAPEGKYKAFADLGRRFNSPVIRNNPVTLLGVIRNTVTATT